MSGRLLPVALVLGGLLAGFGHAALTTEELPPCHVVSVADTEPITDEEIAELFAQGYTGDPRDHAERIYSPSCPNAASARALIADR